jgi:hypothetical protein
MAAVTASEGQLLNLIEQLGELEWRRYQARYPLVWIKNRWERIDHSSYLPFVSFRFQHEDPKVIERLHKAIASYQGAVKWELHGHKRRHLQGMNWVIVSQLEWNARELSLPSGVRPGRFVAEHYPEFGPAAYEDFRKLEEHARREFGL